MKKHDKKSFDAWAHENKSSKKGVSVQVRNNDINTAIKILKKKSNREGITKTLREKEYFESKGQIRRRKKNESVRRLRKELAQRKLEEGF